MSVWLKPALFKTVWKQLYCGTLTLVDGFLQLTPFALLGFASPDPLRRDRSEWSELTPSRPVEAVRWKRCGVAGCCDVRSMGSVRRIF